MSVLGYDPQHALFHLGAAPARVTIAPRTVIEVECEDAFSGRLDSVDGRPREVAPFPYVNPLTGPIAVTGAEPGDILAVHLLDVSPLREWGVSTLSPDFGALSGTAASPNIQRAIDERVWIWTVDEATGTLTSPTPAGPELRVPLRPFLGTVGVAPAHGEIRTSVVPGAFGGNLDLPVLGPGATLYLRVNEPGALLHVGDGHLTQGDGEFAGTAVEAAVRTRLVTEVLPDDGLGAAPRIETDSQLIAVGWGRPLEDAARVAVHALTRWVAAISGLPVPDAYQLVSQACETRVGNLVNPAYTVAVGIVKDLVPGLDPATSAHERLRSLG
ncbi:MAG: acetamidase/formamidase family protein [Georgenia sp.]